MSNGIRFDSLLLRELAAELAARLRGLRVSRAQLERSARVLSLAAGPRRSRLTLSWNLHPASGHVLLVEGETARGGALLQVPAGAPIAQVSALPDERILRIQLEPGAVAPGLVRALVLELIGSRWNALALGADDVIVDMLVARATDPRGLRAGVPYLPPPARPRHGVADLPALAVWQASLAPAPALERRQALLAGFAYTSPLNADWILGDALHPSAGEHELEAAYRRYLHLVSSPAQPCLLEGFQPYTHPVQKTAAHAASLLAAFSAAAEASGAAPVALDDALREQVLAALHEREQRLLARRDQLEQEAAGAAADASRLRADADLLLANLRAVPRGASEAQLIDFAGQVRQLELDPARSAQRNAQHWYEQARRREHASERVPALLARLLSELQRLAAVRDGVRAGTTADADLLSLTRRTQQSERPDTLPYRKYRTSGGLEVRVGRNARANDALTRGHSAPDDIWLHARDAGGAHVVLRWGRREANPPRSDLLEAAGLAASHSRARTSALVPVDWTRRKYVRKPRKAAPGQVVMERASTVFVAPDPALERRLRDDDRSP